MRNHNRLLGRVEGVDGIKTGYIHDSGFNLVTSVRNGGRHMVAVVFGGRTASARDAHMRRLSTHIIIAARKRTAPPVGEPLRQRRWAAWNRCCRRRRRMRPSPRSARPIRSSPIR